MIWSHIGGFGSIHPYIFPIYRDPIGSNNIHIREFFYPHSATPPLIPQKWIICRFFLSNPSLSSNRLGCALTCLLDPIGSLDIGKMSGCLYVCRQSLQFDSRSSKINPNQPRSTQIKLDQPKWTQVSPSEPK